MAAIAWHRRSLRRYIRLPIGAPESFTCRGGWHQAIDEIGDFPGEILEGSIEERSATPPRSDRRWPLFCDDCTYRFTERDRYQLVITPISLGEIEP